MAAPQKALIAVFATLVFSLAAGKPGVARAERIVSLVPAATEMLYAFGAGSRVVAVSSYDTFPPAVKPLPKVGALLDPNVERILALKPDLVVVYGSQDDLKRQLTRARVRFFDYRHAGLADITSTIRTLGAQTGDGPAADTLANTIARIPGACPRPGASMTSSFRRRLSIPSPKMSSATNAAVANASAVSGRTCPPGDCGPSDTYCRTSCGPASSVRS